MFPRILGLVVLVLLSILPLNFGFRMVSAPNNMQVVIGLGALLGLVVAWYYIGRSYGRYFRHRLSGLTSSSDLRDSRHLVVVLALILGAIASTGCGRTVVNPGHVGVTVDYYGQDRGVESYPKVTGVVWYNPITTSVLEYPTYVQTAVWTKDLKEGHPQNEEISFNTKDQMVITGDISLSYQLSADKIPAFYVKFRSDDLNGWTHGFLRNVARDAFNELSPRYTLEEIYGAKKEEFVTAVRARINSQINPFGANIEQFGFIGVMRLPENVEKAINAKIEATQKAIQIENEVRQATAEAQKAVAKAEGEAKSNQLVNSSLTPNLLEWRRLDIQNHATSKWNGVLPVYTGSSMPLIQLPSPK